MRKGAGSEDKWEQVSSISNLEISVPQELARLIELEIDRLAPREQRVLEAGSLMNIAFPVWAAAAALEENQEDVEELCDDWNAERGWCAALVTTIFPTEHDPIFIPSPTSSIARCSISDRQLAVERRDTSASPSN